MSTVKVNTIDKRTGSTLTLGGSGTAVTLACGATQTGFGRTGTVDWCTTAKTSPFTAVSGDGFFVNTAGGVITVTLPSSPSAGDIVALKDYGNTWDTNNVTIGRGGSKINGVAQDAVLNTESQSVTLIYVDGTKGWQSIQDSTTAVTGTTFVCASGGNTILTVGDFKTHVFTSSGTFTVNSVGTSAPNNNVDYLVIAGGASGGRGRGGGGGAGGFRTFSSAPGNNSPLIAPAGTPISAQGYPITVGAGGAVTNTGTPSSGNSGTNSIFSAIISAGGGGGSAATACDAKSGGSGGGVGYVGPGSPGPAGAGNTPPVSPPQGNTGGTTSATGSPTPNPQRAGGAGGGAGAVGGNSSPGTFGVGGAGSNISDTFFGPTAPSYGTAGPVSSTRYFAGGGGSSAQCGAGGAGGAGGGGAGSGTGTSTAGTVNTGGASGGSGEAGSSTTGAGGSGFVAIRYKFQ